MFSLFVAVLITFNSAVQSLHISPASHSLYSALHHFETLHKVNDVHHRVVRDNMPHPGDNLRQIKFRTLGRDFRLLVSPHTRPFHPHAEAHSAGHTHSKKRVNVHQFFQGHVLGTETGHVVGHVTDDGIITAIITIGDDSYYVEPSFRHFSGSHDFHMITYRGSDLKYNMTGEPHGQFCGAAGLHDRHDSHYGMHRPYFDKTNSMGSTPSDHTPNGRLKRQSALPDASKVCPVNIIATTSFYEKYGGSDEEHTINGILVVMLQIDAIFRGVDWSIPGVSNSFSIGVRGFQIANITVLTTTDNSPEYNADQSWNSEELLNEFARTDWTDYCLSHLFTARRFSDSSTLGVAYTAIYNSYRAGGICATRSKLNGKSIHRNVGVSSYRGKKRVLVLAEAVVVTGHGHSWGGRHDDATSECSPSNNRGGKYIMYAVAQDGEAPNNMRFSNCSRRAISKVLGARRRDRCFVEPSDSLCGNFIIDEGEECDPGPTAVYRGGDLCCNDDCTFKSSGNGARFICSDANHDCCTDCRPTDSGEVCHQEEEGNMNCHGNRTCNGNITCPSEVVFVEEGTSCGILGQCIMSNDSFSEIECVNFCERMGLVTCYCTGEENECSLCCMESVNGTDCRPFNNQFNNPPTTTLLPAGSFCEGGTCDGEGVCIPSDTDLSSFLADLLNDLNNSIFVKLIGENIVASVIIISLIIWIPATLLVNSVEVNEDKKKRKDLKKDWRQRNNI